jgi:hypothetical protein
MGHQHTSLEPMSYIQTIYFPLELRSPMVRFAQGMSPRSLGRK